MRSAETQELKVIAPTDGKKEKMKLLREDRGSKGIKLKYKN